MIDDFFNTLYYLQEELQDDDACIDHIFNSINEFLLSNMFGTCDKILERVIVSDFTPTILIGFLTITAAAKDKLTKRNDFYLRVSEVVDKKLLKGLE